MGRSAASDTRTPSPPKRTARCLRVRHDTKSPRGDGAAKTATLGTLRRAHGRRAAATGALRQGGRGGDDRGEETTGHGPREMSPRCNEKEIT